SIFSRCWSSSQAHRVANYRIYWMIVPNATNQVSAENDREIGVSGRQSVTLKRWNFRRQSDQKRFATRPLGLRRDSNNRAISIANSPTLAAIPNTVSELFSGYLLRPLSGRSGKTTNTKRISYVTLAHFNSPSSRYPQITGSTLKHPPLEAQPIERVFPPD